MSIEIVASISDETLADVDAVFAAHLAAGRAPGIAYGVVVDGVVVHGGGVGEQTLGGAVPDTSTVFRIASMTKSFTATAVMMLVDDGSLELDEPIGTYVPELLDAPRPTSDAAPMTLRLLLTMGAGLPTDDPWGDRQESLALDAFGRLLSGGVSYSGAPGTGFEYSNLGYAIVGRAIANVSGVPYVEFVRTNIIEPLRLTSTVFDAADLHDAAVTLATGHRRRSPDWIEVPFDHSGAFSPIGGLYSSVDDLARWIGGFTAAFPARDGTEGGHPLRRWMRREMQQQHRFVEASLTPHSPAGPGRVRSAGYGFGLLIEHDTRWGDIVGHSGGYPGFGTNMRWHPPTGVGVICLANGTYARASEPAAAALEVVLAAVSAPSRRVRPWPATRAAAAAVDGLLREWDDAVADRLFAENVDLDLPRADRRADVAAMVAQLGTVTAADSADVQGRWPAHAEWAVRGTAGRLLVDISLTPQTVPLVQTLNVRFVAAPSDALAATTDSIVAGLSGSAPAWPDDVAAAVSFDVEPLVRWFAATATSPDVTWTVDPEPLEATSPDSATFALRGAAGEWRLSVAIDADGAVTECAVTAVALGAGRWVRTEPARRLTADG